MLLDEGLENVWRRRAGLNAALLAAGGALGLRQFAARPSPAVAALVVPEGIGARAVLSAARARGATLAGGQGELAGTIIRPSLLGYADRYDAVAAAQLLEDALHDVDADTPKGVAVPAALRALAGEA